MEQIVLAADLGGTSCRFGVFQWRGSSLVKLDGFWTDVAGTESFESLLGVLIDSTMYKELQSCDAFVLAAAGPVKQGRYCSPPNIDWDIDLAAASRILDLERCTIINDFVAQAFATVSPLGAGAKAVLPGTAVTDRPIAVVGAGTGLGKAYLIPDKKGGYLPGASEGGHVNFAAETAREFELFRFGCDRFQCEYLTMEHVLSGRGLSLVHEFLTGRALDAKDVAAEFSESPETVKWFSRFYGRASRNFALDVLARGGLFIVGGIAAKNPELVEHEEFARSFRSSPTHADILADIPVSLVSDQESGLWGAAYAALQSS